jgi:hypothetical protein
MNVISASRRTDIPAFHPIWFMERVHEGYADVVSPFRGRVSQVSLDPADVAAIVFWTKNAAPLLPFLDELTARGHCFTFLYTVNLYPASLEPSVPDWSHTRRVLKELAFRLGRNAFRWRYDTIVLTEKLTRDWHVRNFQELCRSLSGLTEECIFSFCDYYRKTVRNMEGRMLSYRRPDESECKEMAEEMAVIAEGQGIVLSSCAHDMLVSSRVRKARCIDPAFLLSVADSPVRREAVAGLKAAPTRRHCGCASSLDIGAYDTCGHGCVYCYANANAEAAAANLDAMAPGMPCLTPRGMPRLKPHR